MDRYAQKIPYKPHSEEWKSFLNYAREHYSQAIALSLEIVKSTLSPEEYSRNGTYLFRAVFDKISSPLVYIWERWQLLTAEDKLPYATPEYKQTLQKIMQKSRELAEQIGQK